MPCHISNEITSEARRKHKMVSKHCQHSSNAAKPDKKHNSAPKTIQAVGSAPTKRKVLVPTRKKRRVENDDNPEAEKEALNDPAAQAQAQAQADANPEPDPMAQEAMLDQSWWDAGNATRHFGAIDDEVSPREAVEKHAKQQHAMKRKLLLKVSD
jgi:hypothetical protein